MNMSNEFLHMLTHSYRNEAFDTFIRRLNGDLPKLLGVKEPADLPQALHLCFKLENQNVRANNSGNFNLHLKGTQCRENGLFILKSHIFRKQSNRVNFLITT